MTAQMLLVWPIEEPPRSFHYLIDLALDDVKELVEEQGCHVAGAPDGWSVEVGQAMPGWAAYRLVLTCTVPVTPQAAAALEEAA